MTPEQSISLKEFVERLIAEHDRRYEAMIQANKELTAAAFSANSKAIDKAENAQREYNERTNELRGALNDQSKLMLTRTEADVHFKTIEDKIEGNRKDIEKAQDTLRSEIIDLREYRSGTQGKEKASEFAHGQFIANRTLLITVAATLIGWAITILLFILKS